MMVSIFGKLVSYCHNNNINTSAHYIIFSTSFLDGNKSSDNTTLVLPPPHVGGLEYSQLLLDTYAV